VNHVHCDQDPHSCSFDRLWADYQATRRELKVWKARALQAERRFEQTRRAA